MRSLHLLGLILSLYTNPVQPTSCIASYTTVSQRLSIHVHVTQSLRPVVELRRQTRTAANSRWTTRLTGTRRKFTIGKCLAVGRTGLYSTDLDTCCHYCRTYVLRAHHPSTRSSPSLSSLSSAQTSF